MNKELRDLVWRCLPKEFKEEVKDKWRDTDCGSFAEKMLESIFGLVNLTFDTEGEEMLCVSRKRVQNIYAQCQKIEMDDSPNLPADTIDAASTKMTLLSSLFGAKCLLDEAKDTPNVGSSESNVDTLADNVDSLSQNPSENCDNGNLISTDDNKQAEPKFKVGDRVRYKGDGKTYTIHMGNGFYLLEDENRTIKDGAVTEQHLEPYTEPDTSHETPVCENHSDNTSQKEVNVNSNRNLSQETANCDKQLDNILKDSFSKERRLNIAAMAMQGMLTRIDDTPQVIAEAAFRYADALIAENEKGGRYDN